MYPQSVYCKKLIKLMSGREAGIFPGKPAITSQWHTSKTGNYSKAMSLFDKMHDNPRHLYQKTVNALYSGKPRLLSTEE